MKLRQFLYPVLVCWNNCARARLDAGPVYPVDYPAFAISGERAAINGIRNFGSPSAKV